MSFIDDQFKRGAYYDQAPPGQEEDYLLPWKIEWDPSRGSDHYSYEVIQIDLGATEVSGQDPATYERFFNPSSAEAVLPLRHSLFDASPSHPIIIETLTHGGTSWQPLENAVGVEGVDTSGVFFARRDIPLSGDVGFTVGRMLFLGNVGVQWDAFAYIRVRILYLGDYVQSKSFDQDLHPEANVVHRTLEVDLTASHQRNYSETATARHAKLYRDLQSSFLYGDPKTTGAGRSHVVADASYTYSLQATDPQLRFGIHDIVYSSIDPQDEGQAHTGNWPTGAEYYYIGRDPQKRNTENLNFIVSHLQRPRTDLGASLDEHDNEVAFQYDHTERTWQAGASWDSYRREYNEEETPYLNRRYPILARFAQGRTGSTNEGWVGGSSDLSDRLFPLQQAMGRHALVTTFDNDPTLLQVHPEVGFEIQENGRIQYLEGVSELRLYAPELDLDSGEFVKWVASENDVKLSQGDSGVRRVNLIRSTLRVAPTPTSTVNMTQVRWSMEADATAPVYSLQIIPANADGVYDASTWRDFLRIGMRNHGTDSTAKYAYIGHPDVTGEYIDVERETLTSFDLVFASHMLPRVRGNFRVEGILDSYSDFAIGRNRATDGSFNDTFGRTAMLRGKADVDTVEINRTTSGYLNIKGDTVNYRRASGPTVSRMDMQLRHLLGWDRETIPNMSSDYRDFEPFKYGAFVEDSKDTVDEDTDLILNVSQVTGKVDSYRSKYIQFTYDGGNIVETDFTDDIIGGFINEEDKALSEKVHSGYVRGQLHRKGLTARGEHGTDVPVIMDRAGVPGEEVPHEGDPDLHLNSSDMYLDADGRWRYLFDKVYLPVDNN